MQRVQEEIGPAVERAEKRERSYFFGYPSVSLRSVEQEKFLGRERLFEQIYIFLHTESGNRSLSTTSAENIKKC